MKAGGGKKKVAGGRKLGRPRCIVESKKQLEGLKGVKVERGEPRLLRKGKSDALTSNANNCTFH